MNVWILNPALWAAAQKKATKGSDQWTLMYWRRTKEAYEKIGGRWLEDGVEVLDGSSEQVHRAAVLDEGRRLSSFTPEIQRSIFEPILTTDRSLPPDDF